MVALASLWMPIVLSAVLVFVVSSVIHMVLQYHNSDFAKMPDEDRVLAAMRDAGVGPGDYFFPRADDPKQQMSPEMMAKVEAGPMGTMTVRAGGFNMGKQLGQWFAYSLVLSVFVAYVLSRTLPAGTEYMRVFQIASTVGFLAYCGSEPITSIWWGRSWSATAKQLLDGLLYGLVTAGAFGWLWPAA